GDSQRVEVIRVGAIELRAWRLARWRGGALWQAEFRLADLCAVRHGEENRRRLHAGQRFDVRYDLFVKTPLLGWLRVFVARDSILQRQDVRGIETGIHAQQLDETSD